MKIVFLIQNLYGIGGTIRSTVNLTAALAERHQVEITSLLRTADEPSFAVDPRVAVRDLVDLRPGSPYFDGKDPRHSQPSVDYARGEIKGYLRCSRLTDERMASYLTACDADVVVATRPGLIVYLARYGTRRYLKVGQEHLIHDGQSPATLSELREHGPALDILVTMSDGDAAVYRAKMPFTRTTVVSIPNGVPEPTVEPSTLDTQTIVAAGRLTAVKRYELLIEAFAKVAVQRPGWSLRLYGRGKEAAGLQDLINDLGLNGRALLMGAHSPIETEWAKGSIAAVSSKLESFGMTIVEAMRCGVPVVSVDCPFGPREIIDDGVDGLLVREATPSAMADGLLRLIDDEPLRRSMGAAALRNASRFDPSEIALRYERLFADHLRSRRRGPLAFLRRPASPGKAASTGRAASSSRTVSPDRLGFLERLGARTRSGVRALLPWKAAVRPRVARGPITAHCLVRADGGLTIRLDRGPWAAGKTAAGWSVKLRRHGTDTAIEVPFTPSGEASLERGRHHLVEGRWDVYVARPGQRLRRLASGMCDTRALVNAFPYLEQPLETWTPYVTEQGDLSIAVHVRTSHAEVTDLVSTPTRLTVHGLLVNLPYGPLTLFAQRRGTTSEPEKAAADQVILPAQAHLDGRFSCAVPYDRLVSARAREHEVWDLYLCPGGDDAPIRLGRFCDDIADRKAVDRYPRHSVGDSLAYASYTSSNELSIHITTVEAT
ncbi:glycosyltransferase family 4 protein [Nonomuraea sp. NPDC049152]|uniref:glycosyltransferase family 4 protein n=1 Tax=Nonomuraea sp. NPDC049152 TaxID=3154350 RepID=UPI0034023D82